LRPSQAEDQASVDCDTRLQQGFAASEMGFRAQFAQHQALAADVRFGSKSDIDAALTNFRFTPESRHLSPQPAHPLCAKCRTTAVQQNIARS